MADTLSSKGITNGFHAGYIAGIDFLGVCGEMHKPWPEGMLFFMNKPKNIGNKM